MRRKLLSLSVIALALSVGAARGGEDEQLLKQAGVATDDAGLLQFFRKQSPNEAELRALIGKLGDDSFDVREKASADLSHLGSTAEPFLREALKSRDAEVVRRARDCLTNIRSGPSAAVMAAAVRLLSRRNPAGSAEVLLAYAARISGDANEEEARAAVTAVAVRDGKPEPVLLAALEDKSSSRRTIAAVALARAGARDALPALRKRLHDADLNVRLETALALIAMKDKEAVPTLIDLLAELPRRKHGPIESILDRLAEDKAPEGLVSDEEAERKKYRDAWSDWWKKNGDKTDLAKLTGPSKFLGYTMLVLLDGGRILERDADGKTRWKIEELNFPLDAQRLPGDRVLVAEHKGNRITERDRKGHIIWEKSVDEPVMAQRLPNGNTFIVGRHQLLELDRNGKEVFSQERGGDQMIMRGYKLDNGDIALVVSIANQGRIDFERLDHSGKQIAQFPVEVQTSGGRIEVLSNGRVLAPLQIRNKVVEYDSTGKIVWEADVIQPVAATRLSNGHTMVTSYQDTRAIELDSSGKTVGEFKADERVTRGFRR